MAKRLMKGSEAIAEAAVRNGCRYFFGYPITPQTEIPEYLSWRMFDEDVGGCFLQAESEIAAINMVYGAAATGVRAMTSSSGPGISLMQEGISTLCAAELPCLIVNVMRGGPGIGSIQASQGDYFQTVKGGGHGDYRMITFAPSSVQEAVDCIGWAFPLAEVWRMPVMVCADGMLAQMMESVELPDMMTYRDEPEGKPWAATGWDCKQPAGERGNITSLNVDTEQLELLNVRLQGRYGQIRERECRWEAYNMENAQLVVTAFGTVARIVKSVIDELRGEDIHVGMLRPITIWPFPYAAVREAAVQQGVKGVLDVELNAGQMLEDVRLAVNGAQRVAFFGHCGSRLPTADEIRREVLAMLEE